MRLFLLTLLAGAISAALGVAAIAAIATLLPFFLRRRAGVATLAARAP